MTQKLKELAVGDRAQVTGFSGGSTAYRRKLLSMGGLTLGGAEFTVNRRAPPLGDPIEIRVRGYSLSLRGGAEAEALDIARV